MKMNKFIGNTKSNGFYCPYLTQKRNCRETKKRCPLISVSDKEIKQVITEKIKELDNPKECYYFQNFFLNELKGGE